MDSFENVKQFNEKNVPVGTNFGLSIQTKDLIVNPVSSIILYSFRIVFSFFTLVGEEFPSVQVFTMFKPLFEQIKFTQGIVIPLESAP